MEDKLSMTIPGRPEYIPVAKQAVQSVASVLKFDIETIDNIGMAVFEACKSIICHHCEDWCRQYSIEVTYEDQVFEVKIIADEEAYEKRKTFQMCENCPRDGDLSIAVIKSLMDEFEIDFEDAARRSITMRKRYVS